MGRTAHLLTRGGAMVALTAGLALLAPALAAAGANPKPKPVSEAAVRACIRDNLVRYTNPSKAIFAQYVDLAAACRTALARGKEGDVKITPLRSRKRKACKAAVRRAPVRRPSRPGQRTASCRKVVRRRTAPRR